MGVQTIDLKNVARGSGSYQQHRLPIVRSILEREARPEPLSQFLRDALFRLTPAKWTLFNFGAKDWEIGERLLATRSPQVEAALLDLATMHVEANLESVRRLLGLQRAAASRLLDAGEVSLIDEEEPLEPLEAQSLLGLRLQCAANQASTDAMRRALISILPQGWARSQLSYPLMYHFAAHPPARQLDSFLSYITTGSEPEAERLALKLLLNPDAARQATLSFRLYVGLMGHPYDTMELAMDQLENEIAQEGRPSPHLLSFAQRMAALFPGSRADQLASVDSGQFEIDEHVSPTTLSTAFSLPESVAARYSDLTALSVTYDEAVDPERPYDILSNMRLRSYPTRSEFEFIYADAATWFFTDGGRLITALLRMLYMIDRADPDTETRDALRLLVFFRTVTPLIAASPSAMMLLRRLQAGPAALAGDAGSIERWADHALRSEAAVEQRTWISLLQWKLRQLEEDGRIEEWLGLVREETRLRPSYLTGINWHWVEEIIGLRRLRPFRSFDGAYLFIHMELEWYTNPLRLRLILDPLLSGLPFEDLVGLIVREFGVAAPAIVRRYLTTQNMLASGQAPNYVAALDQRIRALEACIKSTGFTALLTEDMYKGEVRTLTTELLLNNVNAGKFEVPWDTFRKDANNSHEDLILAVESLRSRMEGEGQLTELVEMPIIWPNGVAERYKLRQRDRARFSLVVQLIDAYMQHPTFGLEVILSGRFRHNHLLQELWSALAETDAAVIPSVGARAQALLIEEYRVASETFVDAWCAARMQTVRPDKPEGLFNLVPDQKEMERLLVGAAQKESADDVVDVVVDWIKNKLRAQAAAAGEVFATDFADGLTRRFALLRDEQLKAAGEPFRESDVIKVHAPVNDAVTRRIATLRNWFEGIDAAPTDTISLADLSMAVEALFENMLKGRSLDIRLDAESTEVLFGPADVKIAFDMLREIYFNALRYGEGDQVVLEVARLTASGDVAYSFSNPTAPGGAPLEERVAGGRYVSASEAVTREGNSGRAKIAASAATLLGRDTTVLCVNAHGTYRLEVPLRPEEHEAVA